MKRVIYRDVISKRVISKRVISTIIVTAIATVLSVSLLTACGPSQAEIDESTALESAEARLAQAESESESVAESIAAEKESADAVRESIAAKENRPAFYTPADDEKELICGDWWRCKDNGEGDKDIYWLTMDDRGYCTFIHETMNTSEPIDDLEGTWSVDDHGFVNIDLGKYKGKFRFMKNSYGSTNIICNDGDDFVESGDDGEYAAFVPVKWYKGNLRFVEAPAADTDQASQSSTEENSTGTDKTTATEISEGADHEASTPSDSNESNMIYAEMQGEGDKWFRLAGSGSLCKVDVDTREGEIPCRIAINQNDHLLVKIEQIR